ncbi:unnamed protein product [Somion occarium]
MKTLKVANFSDIFTGRLIDEIPLALTALCNGLKDIATLQELNLNDNAFGGRSVHPLVPLLVHNCSIRVLKLDNNGLGPAGGKVVADALLESAKLSQAAGMPSNLRVVICGRNRLEDGSATAWAAAFAAHGNLTKVRMVQNGIREAGFTALVRGLAKCSSLRYLNLRDNLGRNIEEDDDPTEDDGIEHGWHALADALSEWKDLRYLDVSDCSVYPPGFQLLMGALESGIHTKLHTLMFDNNDLDAAVYQRLHDVVKRHLPSVKRLSLLWNEDLDDATLSTLGNVIEDRGGQLILDEEDEEEGDERELEDEKDVVADHAVGGKDKAAEKKVDETDAELESALAGLTISS